MEIKFETIEANAEKAVKDEIEKENIDFQKKKINEEILENVESISKKIN